VILFARADARKRPYSARVPHDLSAHAITRSYLICTVPRTGSALVCQRLRRTGLAGAPYEVFEAGPEATRHDSWNVSTFSDYFEAFRTRTASRNGVIGAKLMWKQVEPAVEKLRHEAGYSGARDDAVLESAFPGLRYLWLKRDDKIRQGLSWWRAETTNKWDIRRDTQIAPAAQYDFDAIDASVQRVIEHNAAWNEWFTARDIVPYQLTYESFLARPEHTLRDILRFLEIDTPFDFAVRFDRFRWKRRSRRQSDEATDGFESRYRAELASLGR